VAEGEISPLALKRATQRTALAMLTPKRLAAALRDMPPSTAPTTRSRRSTESAIPAASCARRQSSSRSKLIRESIPRFNSLGDRSKAFHKRCAEGTTIDLCRRRELHSLQDHGLRRG